MPLRLSRTLPTAALVAAAACGGAAPAERPAPAAGGAAGARGTSDFALFTDEYLDAWARRHPSIAAGNGLHGHDHRLEDFSEPAIRAEIADLRQFRARLAAMDTVPLSADERVDRLILAGVIDGWLLELATLENWRRNPMIYASAVSDGVHNLMTMESDAAEVRMRRAASKLRGVPALMAAARANLVNPPRILAERGIGMLHGTAAMLEADLPRAFAGVRDEALQAELRGAADTARRAIGEYVRHLESVVLPRATGVYAVGARNVEARYRAEELIDLPVARLLAIGERELARAQAEFRTTAASIDSTRDAQAVWRDVLRDHPRRGELVAAAQRSVDDLQRFVVGRRLVDLPSQERVVVAQAPEFDLGLASMHSSPPLEATPVKSYYYVTDASASWPAERQDAWLQKFNYATLSDISAHEVMPGHYVHSLFMRRTPGKVRRIWIGLNPFPQPSSGQDGWAHYAEQLVIDEGFRADEPKYRLAQISEALTRICRLLSSTRLHTGEWTVDQAARFFEENAYLPSPAARQEAERGTYDPTNGGYFLGKLAMQKLRRDYQAAQGARFDLRAFHERVMTNGIAPWRAHRLLMLPGDTGAVLE